MFDFPYLVEVLSPRKSPSPCEADRLQMFAERCCRAFDMGMGISVPDNPMGQRRYSLPEMVDQAGISVDPERVVMNLNTFHGKAELDHMLQKAMDLGIRYLLVVRGDGGPELDKLPPESIGGSRKVATSIDLLRYINTAYEGRFVTGCAYNHYNPMPFETNRLKEKIEAGARFVITQPVIGRSAHIDEISGLGVPVIVEAWMSKNTVLLFKSIRQSPDENAGAYDPVVNLRALHENYPASCIYLSMLGFRKPWRPLLPRIASAGD